MAVDLDDVLVPHFGELVAWYNTQYGTALTLADNGKGDLSAWDATTREQAIRRVHQFLESEAFRSVAPYTEAREVLRRLADEYRLVVVTARDSLLETFTHHWLLEHFGELFEGVHFTASYSLEGKARQKKMVLKDIGAQCIIDDSLEHVCAAADLDIKGVLFGNYPWNQAAELPSLVTRCRDWSAVEEYFKVQ